MASRKNKPNAISKASEQAILTVIAAECALGSSVRAAADRNGISYWRVQEYLRSVEGRELLTDLAREIRAQATREAIARIESAAPRAVDMLLEIMDDPDARQADRLKAALGVLDRVGLHAKREIVRDTDASAMSDSEIADRMPEVTELLRKHAAEKASRRTAIDVDSVEVES